ncbi:MAG: class I SAM-dependent methyltransferase [Desulfocapsa sp.]|nr:class I SAM-dependent methyltransferase [Desulfocapsa sp.]
MYEMTSAYKHWNKQWQSCRGRQGWTVPEPSVISLLPALKEKGVERILDLGGGVGRHALYFAAHGFKVNMSDLSAHGLDFARGKAKEAGIELSTHIADMATLPFEADFFDYVLAWNVIYHGNKRNLIQSLVEINRILRVGGFFQATLLSKNNYNFRIGDEVSKDTWVNSRVSDKAHPHYYCNEKELNALFTDAGFLIKDLEEVEQSLTGSFHWNVVAHKTSQYLP